MSASAHLDLTHSPLQSDPRLLEAKRLLAELLEERTRHIQHIRPADPDKKEAYQDLLNRLANARGGATYFPYLSSGLGNGPYVELADGSIKLDFIGGIGVHGLGHNSPLLLNASIDSALEDTVMQGNLQQNPITVTMSETLIKMACKSGATLKHCMISTSGAMSNENALKIAFHNRFPADRVLALDHCFAGRSIALAQLTDKAIYRTGLPTAIHVDHIPTFQTHRPQESIAESVATLKKLLHRHPNQYSCLWLELVAGEGGYYPGSPDYFRAIIELCKEQNILVVFDEVQTFSRLSRPYAFQHYGLDAFADIVTIGKITQVCATLFREELRPKGPLLSQTFTGSSASFATGLAILRELEAKGCFGDDGWNMRRHRYFAAKLQGIADRHPGKLNGPFGEGMMIAFTPGKGTADEAKAMVFGLYDAGLMSFVAGSDPYRVRFLPPPGITTEAHIDLASSIIEKVVASAN